MCPSPGEGAEAAAHNLLPAGWWARLRPLCPTTALQVCAADTSEPARMLNFMTAPQALIWSAVAASSAFPGLFPAQHLLARNSRGEVVRFSAPSTDTSTERRWRDGSLELDLPTFLLAEMFNCNHFLVGGGWWLEERRAMAAGRTAAAPLRCIPGAFACPFPPNPQPAPRPAHHRCTTSACGLPAGEPDKPAHCAAAQH